MKVILGPFSPPAPPPTFSNIWMICASETWPRKPRWTAPTIIPSICLATSGFTRATRLRRSWKVGKRGVEGYGNEGSGEEEIGVGNRGGGEESSVPRMIRRGAMRRTMAGRKMSSASRRVLYVYDRLHQYGMQGVGVGVGGGRVPTLAAGSMMEARRPSFCSSR